MRFKRFWEIDTLRGIAIIMMITFHTIFDLNYFGHYTFNLQSGFWFFFARLTASIFIFLVGLSLTISYARAIKEYKTELALFGKYLKRGLKLFSLGLVISLVTWFLFREGFIIFGILHFIGVSIILAYPLLKLRCNYLILGIAIIVSVFLLKDFAFTPWLLWLLPWKNFYTLDYFPLLPWFGLVLVGIFFGNSLYPNGKRKFNICDYSKIFPIKLIAFLGRHSLIIYFLHQPILVALLYIL